MPMASRYFSARAKKVTFALTILAVMWSDSCTRLVAKTAWVIRRCYAARRLDENLEQIPPVICFEVLSAEQYAEVK